LLVDHFVIASTAFDRHFEHFLGQIADSLGDHFVVRAESFKVLRLVAVILLLLADLLIVEKLVVPVSYLFNVDDL